MIGESGGAIADICIEMGTFVHACEGEIVCESNNVKIPYFNAPIYLENKVSIFSQVHPECPAAYISSAVESQ